MTLFILLLSHVLFIGWGIGMSQKMQHDLPWWRRRFRLACLPHPDQVFWLTRMRRGYTWERAECGAHTFNLWQLPSALILALNKGAQWRDLWIRWV